MRLGNVIVWLVQTIVMVVFGFDVWDSPIAQALDTVYPINGLEWFLIFFVMILNEGRLLHSEDNNGGEKR